MFTSILFLFIRGPVWILIQFPPPPPEKSPNTKVVLLTKAFVGDECWVAATGFITGLVFGFFEERGGVGISVVSAFGGVSRRR